MKSIKMIMLLLIMVVTGGIAQSQKERDIVKLKNGSIIKGRIIEQVPNDFLRIRTSDGSEFVFKMEEVEKITIEEPVVPKTVIYQATPSPTPEPPDIKLFGGVIGLGVVFGGGGIAGVPFRISPSHKLAFEFGVFAKPNLIVTRRVDSYGNEYGLNREFFVSPLVTGGVDIYLGEKFQMRMSELMKNGIFLRAGVNLNDKRKETLLASGWTMERFNVKNKTRSLVVCVGGGVLLYDEVINWYGTNLKTAAVPAIYWKIGWSWYVK